MDLGKIWELDVNVDLTNDYILDEIYCFGNLICRLG